MICALLAPVPWMGPTAAAPMDTPIVATLAYTYYTPAFDPPALRVGDECFIPAKLAGRLGWQATIDKDKASVEVNGTRIETFVRELRGAKYLPVRTIVASVGGLSEWGTANDLRVFSKITEIKSDETGLAIRAALPIKKTVFTVDRPFRVVVDLSGARLDPGGIPANDNVRFSQFDKNTVRVVAQVDAAPVLENSEGGSIVWRGAKIVPMLPVAPDTEPKPPVSNPPPIVKGGLILGKMSLLKDTQKETILRIPLSGALATRVSAIRDRDGVYWINLPTAVMPADAESIEGAVIQSTMFVENTTGGVRLKMELKRPMGVKVAPSAKEIIVRMVEPKNSGGTMATKSIVIDPGHGGHDTGAHYTTGGQTLNEKDFTLAIAKLVSDALSNTGCTVAMTRNDDTFIELPDRPRIANESNADFFVSIHINSNQLGNRSGTTTYYHFDDPDSRLLAQCIQAEIAKISGIGDYGSVTDRTVAPSKGFSVLRNSRVPSVLVEVAYINNATDRKLLQTEEFKKKIADAIVRGIKVYIGDQKK